MATIVELPPAKPSEPRERLLRKASALFYAEGINTVGVDRIVSEANVTRATFYRHFPSKTDLVLAYLQSVHDVIAAQTEGLAPDGPPEALLRALGEDVAGQVERPGFRGCAFINAALEHEEDGPVRRAVAAHRAWYHGVIRDAFAAVGHPLAEEAAQHFVMLRDGAMSGAHLDGTAEAADTLRRGVDGLLALVRRGPDDPAS
jgi:AcrR family transcriptional regulator